MRLFTSRVYHPKQRGSLAGLCYIPLQMRVLLVIIPLIVQVAAIVEFIRRRPNIYWLWIIIALGPLGAGIYLVVEVLPDLRISNEGFRWYTRRKRIKHLEIIVLDNPAPGNYEELADLYSEEKKFDRARQCFDKAISSRTDMPNPFYGRAIVELHLNDFAAATQDLEKVMNFDRKFDYQRAAGLLAYCYSQTGQSEKAERMFGETLSNSTLSETQFNYAFFLAQQGRIEEAREWAQRILNKKVTLPRYLRRKEGPWFRKAMGLLNSLAAAPATKSVANGG
jgi:hypothetical protein